MKNEGFAKLKEIIFSSENPEKSAKIYSEFGILSKEDEEKIKETDNLVDKHYDLEALKAAVVSEIASHSLEDLEINDEEYRLVVDSLSDEESGIGKVVDELGPENLGISEDDEELDEEDLLDIVEEYCSRLEEEMNQLSGLPGQFKFLEDNGSFLLVFNFDAKGAEEIKAMGSGEEKEDGSHALSEIVAALEDCGMHDSALKLHRIIRGEQ